MANNEFLTEYENSLRRKGKLHLILIHLCFMKVTGAGNGIRISEDAKSTSIKCHPKPLTFPT